MKMRYRIPWCLIIFSYGIEIVPQDYAKSNSKIVNPCYFVKRSLLLCFCSVLWNAIWPPLKYLESLQRYAPNG